MIDLTYAGQPVQVKVSSLSINETTGAQVPHGPLTLPAPPPGMVIVGTAYDASTSTWHILYAVPVAP